MASVRARPSDRVRLAAAIAAVSGALAGCFAPQRTPPGERALALHERTITPPVTPSADDLAPATLSIDEAVARAKRRSARLALAAARVHTAEARTAESGALKNPEVRVQNLRLDQAIAEAPRASTAVRVFPPRPGENDARTAAARAIENAARAELRAEELAEEGEIRWMFQEVLLFEEEMGVAGEAAGSRRALSEAVRARATASLATRVDEAYADLAAAEAAADLASVKSARDAAFAALMDRVGLRPDAGVRLVGDGADARALPALPDETALIAAALRARPEIVVSASRVDAADAAAYVERAQRWPWFSFLQVGYDVGPGVRDGLGFSFAAGIDVPVLDTHADGVARAEAERSEAQRRLEAQVESIAREVRERLREARAARELLASFEASATPVAVAAAEAAKEALAAGQIDLVRMHLVEERRAAVAMQRLRLVRRYRLAIAALGVAAGGALPRR